MPAARPPEPSAGGALRTAALAALIALGGCGDKSPVEPAQGAPRTAAATAPAAPPGEPAVAPSCGGPGMPDCPLQAWMDSRLNGPLSRDAYPLLVRAFRDLEAAAPPGYPGWSAWAHDGATAAERADRAAVHRACAGCHDIHRARYRKTMRDRPVMRVDPP